MTILDRLIAAREAECQRRGLVALCSCGRGYTAEEWSTLRYVGEMLGLEMRDCTCGSSISRVVDDEPCPDTERAPS